MNLDTVSRAVQHDRKIKFWGTLLLTLFLLAIPLTAFSQSDDGHGFDHVFVIMMENTGYASLIGNPNAPFINFAANTTGLATNYYGVSHPSQPNYIAATSGDLNGVSNDNDITIEAPNIVDQLEARGKTWKAYMQSYSLCITPLDHSCGNQLYERKHNPFISYKDVQSNPGRVANIVDFNQRVELKFAGPVLEGDELVVLEHSDDKQHSVGPAGPGLEQLEFVDDEILTQARNARRGGGELEVVQRSLEEPLLGQDGTLNSARISPLDGEAFLSSAMIAGPVSATVRSRSRKPRGRWRSATAAGSMSSTTTLAASTRVRVAAMISSSFVGMGAGKV